MSGRTTKSFQRQGKRFLPQPTILIICEDSKSSKKYFEDARAFYRVDFTVQVAHCGNTDPLGIVRHGISHAKAFEEIYCAIDRDDHENFDDAVRLSEKISNLHLIVSYPCFEYWLLLHFGHTTRPYRTMGGRTGAQRLVDDLRRSTTLNGYDKGAKASIFSSLSSVQLAEARKLSSSILAAAIQIGDLMPSTQIHELFDLFDRLATPQPAPEGS